MSNNKQPLYTVEHIRNGLPVPPAQRIQLFSDREWEAFVEECQNGLQGYYSVRRFGGSGDMGVDVAGFYTEDRFQGQWDLYQCKHYKDPLTPSNVYVEIGKIIYYSFKKEYTPPQKYYFCAPHGVGTKLEQLLNNADKFKKDCQENWAKHCQNNITKNQSIPYQSIPLEGELLEYFNHFDFRIFSSKSHLELIEIHRRTRHHAVRFGGGFPPRPATEIPPELLGPQESRYVQQLLEAYGDHQKVTFNCPGALEVHPTLHDNFKRQRECFYHAEGLKNFARDTVPEGTFNKLKEEIFQGVSEICEDDDHKDGYKRMNKTVSEAAKLQLTSNPLIDTTQVQDRKGICHHLANEDRLTWVKQHAPPPS